MHKDIKSVIAMAGIFILAQCMALSLAPLFIDEGMEAFEDEENVANPLIYLVIVLAFTGVILLIAKLKKEKFIQIIILGAVGTTTLYVFFPLFSQITTELGPIDKYEVAFIISIIIGVFLTYALYKFPEWYVVDSVGVIIAAGAATIFGISLAILPAMILLISLAIYDAISVYKTKHMIDLADSVVDLRLPILIIIPKKWSYSYLNQKRLKEQLAEEEEREAMFMGLGDIVIPCVLVISAFKFLSDETMILGIGGNIVVALITMLGGLIGFFALMYFVLKGKPQAGLPLLNSGTIIAYLISSYAIYQSFGIKSPI